MDSGFSMKKVFFNVLTIALLILIILGCKYTKKPFIQRIPECTYDGRMNEYTFYPFDTTKFSRSIVDACFKKGVEIDSMYSKLFKGDSVLYYTYKDDISKVVLSLYNLSKGQRNFDVACLELRSNILVFKNGIRINMSRSDFFKTLGIQETDCDTFEISLDQEYSGKYFWFVFVDDKLSSISKKYVH